MHFAFLTGAVLGCATALSAQNLVPNGEFEQGNTGWTMTAANDPLGTNGITLARVTGNGPSTALFGSFQTLTPVMSATWRAMPMTLNAGNVAVGFDVMFEKQVTTPIPSVTVNRVELRIYDATNTRVYLGTQNAPNQTGLFERASFRASFAVPAAGVYTAELFLRHSNLAGIPFTLWVDNLFVDAPVMFTFDQGCAGSGGITPVIGSLNWPGVGTSNFQVELNDAYAPTLGLLALDFTRTNWQGLPLPYALGGGCELKVGLSAMLANAVLGTSGAASAAQVLPIPNLPGLVGRQLFAQWDVIDPAAANPYAVATTAGFGFTIQ